ncbi:cysteine methyltransferase [Variovorax sp. WS11]|uniref:methylated-DNA--[protein]-cysteine S-methyltransferase n=1 Tax=Variovorax sp. WS11 TaxID=1105204 RepID=UPI000D0D32C3|nr:methylated-DNA--[protein]-cysteine S-methyltransferase [Variovorax sp. WS11]NDZ16532.1 methylated-DNA--[protein]-cysteine S-methyltransferase [Variovorax sp. WS11]PSL85893.1 cysteine methyltransferase [Variovorax sp. WS11]
MNPEGFALFDTAIGACGIAWGARGIVGVQLPEAGEGATRSRMQRRFAQVPEVVPPATVQAACDAIRALLEGAPRDLAEIVLDYQGVPDFHRRVYEIARRIVPGHTRSYGEIAAELGDKGLSRAVGQALGHNPFAPVVPCHRVLAAGGKPGGFSAHGGATAKLRMLMIEGARPPSDTAPLF